MDTRRSLVSDVNVVQVPQVIVKIGDYEFGSYDMINGQAKFPNYVQSLRVTKINGQVNTYELVLNYLITEYSDPNYFEKVFASVSSTRKISFTYGDCAQNKIGAMYRNEEAMITKIGSSFDPSGALITYTVSAVSVAVLAASGHYDFPAKRAKPSDEIYRILADNEKYGLQDLFTGMRDIALCRSKQVICTSDIEVDLIAQYSVSVLDYLQFLVDNMTRSSTDLYENPSGTDIAKDSFYVITYIDDLTDTFHGPYFQVSEVDANIQHPEAYEVDYGYPGSNLVSNLRVENQESYAILYNYQEELHPEKYVARISATGEYEEVFAPLLSSNGYVQCTGEVERSWWTKVSQYPIKASITIRGLLRPAVLMSYLRLNVLFFGHKHIASGLYIITKQQDTISGDGFTTQLDLVRVAGDESESIAW